jgi:hypothetical protein
MGSRDDKVVTKGSGQRASESLTENLEVVSRARRGGPVLTNYSDVPAREG